MCLLLSYIIGKIKGNLVEIKKNSTVIFRFSHVLIPFLGNKIIRKHAHIQVFTVSIFHFQFQYKFSSFSVSFQAVVVVAGFAIFAVVFPTSNKLEVLMLFFPMDITYTSLSKNKKKKIVKFLLNFSLRISPLLLTKN